MLFTVRKWQMSLIVTSNQRTLNSVDTRCSGVEIRPDCAAR